MVVCVGALFMVLDHVGVFFHVPFLRLLGRLAFPLFAYQIAVSLCYTRSKFVYLCRLIFFGAITQTVYFVLFPGQVNILISFACCVAVVGLFELGFFTGILGVLIYIIFYHFCNFDYGYYGLALVIGLYFLYKYNFNTFYMFLFSFSLTSSVFFCGFCPPIQLFSSLVFLLPLACFDKVRLHSSFFYYFYPVHLVSLYLLSSVF